MCAMVNSIYSQFNTPQLILIGRENFAVWKLAMEALLQVKNLWGCITGDPAYTEDKQKDSLARTLIILSIESYNYSHVQETKTAKEAWDKLDEVFGGSGLTKTIGLLRGSVPTQLIDYSSLDEYVDTIVTSSLKLRDMGFEVTDEWIGIQLLAGLTNNYWPLIVELDATRAKITGDFVKDLLLRDAKKTSGVTQGNSAQRVNDPENVGKTSPDSSKNAAEKSGDDRVKASPSISKNVKDWYNNYCESTYDSRSYQRDLSTSGNSSASALSPSSSIKKDDLEVEVRGEHGGFHEAFVSDVFADEVEVTFDTDWMTRARFGFGDVRLPPRSSSSSNARPDFAKGQQVEVFTRVNEKSPWGWWMARIDTIMGNGHAIVEIPGWLGSKFGHGECVALDRLRIPNRSGPIDRRTFHRREILVPEEQRESAKLENAHKDFQRAIGAAICRYVPERGVLLLISRNENLESLSNWLDEVHFGNGARDENCLLRRLRMNGREEPLFSHYF